mgnify:CR=1 FL=1|tara:strand:- start:170 stop:1213 length:1044 start_codon:yes stop_codon:yes gene_type:complete
MTVNVSKPAFNIREKLSELDKSTGIKGNELMRSETSQEARDLISAGRRNLFHNGACEINQRGTSFSSAGWTTDRWYNYATGGTTTIETSSPPSGFTHYLQAASATSSCIFSQAIELKNQGSAGQFKKGRTLTVSWYAKTTNSGGEDMKLNSSFRQNSTSGTNSVSLTGGDLNVHVKISETWARYSRTFRINVEPHSSSKIIVMQIRTPSGALGTVSLTGFQCEFGSEPTEFEHRSYAEELALCQRYYWQVNDNTYRRICGYKRHDTNVHFEIQCPVPMRAAPSPTLSDGGLLTNFQTTFSATQSNPVISEWNTDTGQGLLVIESTYSSTHLVIPSWEGYQLQLQAEI